MQNHSKRFWSLYVVLFCYAGAVLKMMFDGTYGTEFQPENMPQGGLAWLSLIFTAIFFVGLHSCLNADSKSSKGHEEE